MSIQQSRATGIGGPHFVMHVPETPAQSAATNGEPLCAACDELSNRIGRAAWPTGDWNHATSTLAELDHAILTLAANAVSVNSDGVAPRELAEAAVRDWRRLARTLALTDCRARCDELLGTFLKQETDLLAASRESNGFNAWLRAGTLQLEALAHGPTANAVREQLQGLRAEQRIGLEKDLAHSPPPDASRLRWCNELIDLSEAVQSSAEALAPPVAAAQMELVANDVDWFLEHVETGRSPSRRRLRRQRRQLRGEAQERLLQGRLVEKFGRSNVSRFDQFVLSLIMVVIGLLFVEAFVPLSEGAMFWLHVVDTAACFVFLWDFFVRLALAPRRGRWFLRHFLIDLVPSVPYGLLFAGLHGSRAADAVQLGRAVRLLRVQPLIRMFRAFSFLARGIDRLARRFAPLLNRSVILYPTRAERASASGDLQSLGQTIRHLQHDVQDRWRQLVLGAPIGLRSDLALARLDPLRQAPGLDQRSHSAVAAPRTATARELPAEAMLRRLGGMSARQVVSDLGDESTARLARVVRIFSRPPLNWFPLVRAAAPRIGAWMSDSQIVAAASRQLAAVLKIYHDRWFWLADLHGTVTPSVFVDRLGTMLVKGSFRPAYRLALFGSIYVIVYTIFWLIPFEFLDRTERFLRNFVGPALLVLGGVCALVFSVGFWLKRLAREATEFYEQAAEAQFLSLTEIIRSRHLERDARIFHYRVLRPEWQLLTSPVDGDEQQIDAFVHRVRSTLLSTNDRDNQAAVFDMLQRVVLLYRDSLDGAMFCDNDNRTTGQLLGNPAVKQFLRLSLRIGRKQVKALRFLDLERQKSIFGGPYLWFNFISRAVAHNVACLLVDYNRHAIPLEELPLAPDDVRRSYDRWLTSRAATNTMPDDAPADPDERAFLTTAFTALHFLDFDPQRDREVEQRFGPQMLARLQCDRSLLIRRVFGTYPWNLQPREKRILNLFALYERWLAGGKALLMPLFLVVSGVRHAIGITRAIFRAIREIRHPELRVDRTADIEADFATAVRKIERMRGPVVMASLRMRSAMDPEYLGVRIPGATATGLEGADLQSDLKFLDAEPWVVERLEQDRARAEADMRRLARLIDEGLLNRIATLLSLPPESINTPAHRRAAAVAYLADFRGLRRLMSAVEIIQEVFDRAPLDPPQPKSGSGSWHLKRLFNRCCRQQGIDNAEKRTACWWAVQQNRWGVADALRVWHRKDGAARQEAEAILAEILRHPGRITEQLVTLRSIQTLSILDVLNYRQHIHELGQYATAGETSEDLLHWKTVR